MTTPTFVQWFATFHNELKDTRIKNDYVANMLKMEMAWHAALSQPNEPVGYMTTASLGNLRSGHDVIVGKKLREPDRSVSVFTAHPNTSELEQANKVLADKCKELEEWLETHHDALVKRDAKIAELTAKLEKMRDTLDTAKTGLIWYMENTDQANGCDDDAMAQIDEALEECK